MQYLNDFLLIKKFDWLKIVEKLLFVTSSVKAYGFDTFPSRGRLGYAAMGAPYGELPNVCEAEG